MTIARKTNLSSSNKLLDLTGTWIRPSDWPAMPSITSTDNKFIGLYLVYDTGSAYCGLSASVSSGTYSVDWGDGTTTTHTSGLTATRIFDYANIPGAVTSDGHKVAVVVVTPTTGSETLNNVSIAVRPAGVTPTQSLWLDIAVACSGTVSISLNDGTNAPAILERYIQLRGFVSASDQFNSCRSLKYVSEISVPAGTTSLANFFTNCNSLVISPVINNTSAVTNMSNMFQYCYKLKYINPFPTSAAGVNMSNAFASTGIKEAPRFTMNVSNAGGMFNSCAEIIDFSWSGYNFSACTSVSNMFSSARVTGYEPGLTQLLSTVTATCTNASNMFLAAPSLVVAPMFNTSGITNITNMFNACPALETVPEYNFNAATSISSLFYQCFALKKIPAYNFGNATTNTGYTFGSCKGLSEIPDLNLNPTADYTQSPPAFPTQGVLGKMRCKLPRTASLQQNLLSAAELEIIFDNLTSTYANQTLTISLNPGCPTVPTRGSFGLTAKSNVITQTNTSGLTVGMTLAGTGTPVQTNTSFTTDAAASTFGLAGHNIPNDTPISIIAQTTTTGLPLRTILYVVNAATDTLQVATTVGGTPITFTNNGSCTMRWRSVIASINTNVSVTMTAPMATTGTQTLSYQTLPVWKALLKGWGLTQ